jgi:hypothetical protein
MTRRQRLLSRLAEAIERHSMPVPFSGCVVWLSTLDADGYGQIRVREAGRIVYVKAHRAVHMLRGTRLTKRHVIRHACDVRACINPAHHVRGSQLDNIRDMIERGRAVLPPRSGAERRPRNYTSRRKRAKL